MFQFASSLDVCNFGHEMMLFQENH